MRFASFDRFSFLCKYICNICKFSLKQNLGLCRTNSLLGLLQTVVGQTPYDLELSKGNLEVFDLKTMEVRSILKGLVGVIMIVCFFYQMWDLFGEFLSGLKTVAVSFEEKLSIEFPSFAFCDSAAFKKKIGITSNATLYNSSTFNVEVEASIPYTNDLEGTYTIQYVPTTFNGICKLYEFIGEHKVSTVIGK